MKIIVIVTVILIILGIFWLNQYEYDTEINYHKKLNPKYYKDFTFEMEEKHKDPYLFNQIENGKRIAKNSKIVMCCLARNIEKNYINMKNKLEYIGNQFKDYKIIIVENDSIDYTRDFFVRWSIQNKNVVLLNCMNFGNFFCKLKTQTGYDYGTTSTNRIYRMAKYREECLNYIKQNLSDYEYMLVVDFDLNGNQCMDGIFHSLSKEDWDAVFINGHVPVQGTFGKYTIPYDQMAYADIGTNFDYNINKSKYLHFLIFIYNMIIHSFKTRYDNTHFIPVKSAFNGFALYKINSIKDCSYLGNNLCEHLNLNLQMHKNKKKLYINKLWRGYFDIAGPGSLINILKTHFK